MTDDATRRIPEPLRMLDSLEVSFRSLQANIDRATPVIEGLQRQHAELTATLFSRLEECDTSAALAAVRALKTAVERAGRT